MDYKKIVKYLLIIPMFVAGMQLVELVLPLQKVTEFVTYKRESTSKGFTNYNVDFTKLNDQFTEEIYNELNEQDEVALEVTYFTKEVRSLVLTKSKKKMNNDTSEVYIQTAMALAVFVFSFLFFRKEYLDSRNFRIAIVLLIFGIFSLIRIINVNKNTEL
jgi:1-aminocyclopropane-1-carboxylate deaminase/D-cysteine desulfhydrase-like pyridoxal-dependent ACC family enzyme